MSTVIGHNGPYDPSQPPPPPPMWQPPTWQQAGWPGEMGGPADEGADHYAGGQRKKRHRTAIMTAGALAVALAAGGTAWATVGGSAGPLSTAAIASKIDPGLVDITSSLGYQGTTAEGTGMVLTPSGEILTNNHVIEGATSIRARDVGNGRTYTAKVVGYDSTDDVAVLQLQGASGLATVSLGNSSGLAAGQKVVALGNAEGKGGTPAEVTGSITGLGQAITAEDDDGATEHLSDMVQTNAQIEPGDSGGPLVNTSGQVIGMDTAASTSGPGQFGTTAATTTQAFSIPINRALSIAGQIEAGTSSATVHIGATAFLGIEVGSSSAGYGGYGQTTQGVPVEGVLQGTPAAAAGLSQGDTILAVGGHQVTSASDLESVMQKYHPGDKVSVEWADQYGQTHTSTLTLTAGPAD